MSVVNGQRGQNLTICLAISSVHGLVHYTTVVGGFKSEHFVAFLSEVDELMDEEFVLLTDGARAHTNVPGMGEWHNQRFLPPYSPFLNAAERAGSCLKAALKRSLSQPDIQRQAGDRDAAAAAGITMHQHRLRILQQLIDAAVFEITPFKCRQWVNHSLTYMQRCLEAADIFE